MQASDLLWTPCIISVLTEILLFVMSIGLQSKFSLVKATATTDCIIIMINSWDLLAACFLQLSHVHFETSWLYERPVTADSYQVHKYFSL